MSHSDDSPPLLDPPQISGLLFPHMWSQWCSDAQTLLSGIPSELAAESSSSVAPQPLLLVFERWLLLLKVRGGLMHLRAYRP